MSNPEENVAEMFSDDESKSAVMDAMNDLAEQVAIKNQKVKDLDEQLKSERKLLDDMKRSLGEMLYANNCKNGHKFDNGLYPKPYISTKIFKQAGVTDEQLFDWLRGNDCGDIIKPAVHWQTMNATLKTRIAAGHDLPDDIFNISSEQTMKFVGNGHVKFLANNAEPPAAK